VVTVFGRQVDAQPAASLFTVGDGAPSRQVSKGLQDAASAANITLDQVGTVLQTLVGSDVAGPEAKVQTEIIALLESLECIVIKMTTMRGFGTAGWPDLLVLPPDGVAFFIEVTAPGKSGHATKLQLQRISELNEQGYEAFIADSIDVVEAWWQATFGDIDDDD
jgi:hypothetical protein